MTSRSQPCHRGDRVALIMICAWVYALCCASAAVATRSSWLCSAALRDIEQFAQRLVDDAAALTPAKRDAFAARFADDGFLTRFGTTFEGPFYKADFAANGSASALFDPIASQVGTVRRAFKGPKKHGNHVIVIESEVESKLIEGGPFGPSNPVIAYEAAIIDLDRHCKIKEWASYSPELRVLEELSVALDRPIMLPRGTVNSVDPLPDGVPIGLVVGPGVDCKRDGDAT